MTRRLAHKLAELVRSVQGGAGQWSSARWQDGAIVVTEGHGAPPCEHKYRAFRDYRGFWTGKATCIYCRRQTSWKTKEANATRVKKPYTAPTVRDVELADLPSQTTPRALRMIQEAKFELDVQKEFAKLEGGDEWLAYLDPALDFRLRTLHSRGAIRSRFRR